MYLRILHSVTQPPMASAHALRYHPLPGFAGPALEPSISSQLLKSLQGIRGMRAIPRETSYPNSTYCDHVADSAILREELETAQVEDQLRLLYAEINDADRFDRVITSIINNCYISMAVRNEVSTMLFGVELTDKFEKLVIAPNPLPDDEMAIDDVELARQMMEATEI